MKTKNGKAVAAKVVKKAAEKSDAKTETKAPLKKEETKQPKLKRKFWAVKKEGADEKWQLAPSKWKTAEEAIKATFPKEPKTKAETKDLGKHCTAAKRDFNKLAGITPEKKEKKSSEKKSSAKVEEKIPVLERGTPPKGKREFAARVKEIVETFAGRKLQMGVVAKALIRAGIENNRENLQMIRQKLLAKGTEFIEVKI